MTTTTEETREQNGPSQPGTVIATVVGLSVFPLTFISYAVIPKAVAAQHSLLIGAILFALYGLGFFVGIAVNAFLRARYNRRHPTTSPDLQAQLKEFASFELLALPAAVIALVGSMIAGLYVSNNVPAAQQYRWLPPLLIATFVVAGLGLAAYRVNRYVRESRGSDRRLTMPRLAGRFVLYYLAMIAMPVALLLAAKAISLLPTFGTFIATVSVYTAAIIFVVFLFTMLVIAVEEVKRFRHREPKVKQTAIDKPVMS